MIIVNNERVIMCDIDDTLVLHSKNKHISSATYINVVDAMEPHKNIKLQVNRPMVRLVKEEIWRGSQLVFWSRAGYAWAKNVVEALGLDEFASDCDGEVIVMTKPYAYFDDKDVNEWLKDRVFLEPTTAYKE